MDWSECRAELSTSAFASSYAGWPVGDRFAGVRLHRLPPLRRALPRRWAAMSEGNTGSA
jgi:hypothetical protein